MRWPGLCSKSGMLRLPTKMPSAGGPSRLLRAYPANHSQEAHFSVADALVAGGMLLVFAGFMCVLLIG